MAKGTLRLPFRSIRLSWALPLLGFWLVAGKAECALAVDISQCSQALITDELASGSETTKDARLASLVTDDQWSKAREQLGLNVVLYGIPIGLDYRTYHENASSAKSLLKSESHEFSSAWLSLKTLGDNASHAFVECVKALSKSTGAFAYPQNVSKDGFTLVIQYIAPAGSEPNANYEVIVGKGLLSSDPAELKGTLRNQESLGIPFTRPSTEEVRVVVNVRGHGESDFVIPPDVPPPGLRSCASYPGTDKDLSRCPRSSQRDISLGKPAHFLLGDQDASVTVATLVGRKGQRPGCTLRLSGASLLDDSNLNKATGNVELNAGELVAITITDYLGSQVSGYVGVNGPAGDTGCSVSASVNFDLIQ